MALNNKVAAWSGSTKSKGTSFNKKPTIQDAWKKSGQAVTRARSGSSRSTAPTKKSGLSRSINSMKDYVKRGYDEKKAATIASREGASRATPETMGAGLPGEVEKPFDQEVYSKQLIDFTSGFGKFAQGTQDALQQRMASSGKVYDMTQPRAYTELKEAVYEGKDMTPIMDKYMVTPGEYQAGRVEESPQVAGGIEEGTQIAEAGIPGTPSSRTEIEKKTKSAYPKSYEGQFSQDFQTGYAPGTIEDPNERNIAAVEEVGKQDYSSILSLVASMNPETMNSGELLNASLLVALQSEKIEDAKMNDFVMSLISRADEAYQSTKNLTAEGMKEVDKIIEGRELSPETYAGLQAKILRAQKNLVVESIEDEKEYKKQEHSLWMKRETEKRARLEGYLKSKLVSIGAHNSTAGLHMIGLVTNDADLRLQMAELDYNHGVEKLNLQSREIMQSYFSGIETTVMDLNKSEEAAADKRDESINKIMDQKFLNDREKEKLRIQTFKDYFDKMGELKQKQEVQAFEVMKFEHEKAVDARTYAYQISGLTGTYYAPGPNGELVDTKIPTFEAKKWKNSYLLDVAKFDHMQQYDQYNYAIDLAQLDLSERKFGSENFFKAEELQLERDKFAQDSSMSMFELDLSKAELEQGYQQDMLDTGFVLADYGLDGDTIASITGFDFLKGIESPEAAKNALTKQEQTFKEQEYANKLRKQELDEFSEKFDMGITLIDQGATGAEVETRLGLPTGFFKGIVSKDAMKQKLENKYDMFEIADAQQQLESHNANLKLKALNIKNKAVEIARDSEGNPQLLRSAEQIAGLPEFSLDGLSAEERESKINEQYVADLFTADLKYQAMDGGAQLNAMGLEGPNPINTAYADGYKEDGLECGTFLHKFFDIPPMGDFLNEKIASMDNVLNQFGFQGLGQLQRIAKKGFEVGVEEAVNEALPKLGDMIVMNVGTENGHVMIANSINAPDKQFPQGSVTVTESNYNKKWTVNNKRRINIADSRIVGIHRGDLKPEMEAMLERYEGILNEATIDWNAFSFKMEEIRGGKEVSEKEREQLETWSWRQGKQLYAAVNDAIAEGEKARKEYLAEAEATGWQAQLANMEYDPLTLSNQ